MIWVWIGLGLLGAGIVFWLVRRRQSSDLAPGIILLLRSPIILSAEQIRRLMEPEFGPMEEVERMDVPDQPVFRSIIRVGEDMVRLSGSPAPDLKLREKMASELTDRRVREAVIAADAIFMIESLSWQSERSEEIMAMAAKIAGLVADERAIAFYVHPGLEPAVITDEVRESLRKGDLEGAYGSTEVPVIDVQDDDPRMQAAIQEARDRWPEFLALLASGDGEFYVKARFEHEENVEHMWVEKPVVEGEVIRGRLGNSPMNIPFLKLHAPVETSMEHVTDWMVMRGDETIGGFTVKVLTA